MCNPNQINKVNGRHNLSLCLHGFIRFAGISWHALASRVVLKSRATKYYTKKPGCKNLAETEQVVKEIPS